MANNPSAGMQGGDDTGGSRDPGDKGGGGTSNPGAPAVQKPSPPATNPAATAWHTWTSQQTVSQQEQARVLSTMAKGMEGMMGVLGSMSEVLKGKGKDKEVASGTTVGLAEPQEEEARVEPFPGAPYAIPPDLIKMFGDERVRAIPLSLFTSSAIKAFWQKTLKRPYLDPASSSFEKSLQPWFILDEMIPRSEWSTAYANFQVAASRHWVQDVIAEISNHVHNLNLRANYLSEPLIRRLDCKMRARFFASFVSREDEEGNKQRSATYRIGTFQDELIPEVEAELGEFGLLKSFAGDDVGAWSKLIKLEGKKLDEARAQQLEMDRWRVKGHDVEGRTLATIGATSSSIPAGYSAPPPPPQQTAYRPPPPQIVYQQPPPPPSQHYYPPAPTYAPPPPTFAPPPSATAPLPPTPAYSPPAPSTSAYTPPTAYFPPPSATLPPTHPSPHLADADSKKRSFRDEGRETASKKRRGNYQIPNPHDFCPFCKKYSVRDHKWLNCKEFNASAVFRKGKGFRFKHLPDGGGVCVSYNIDGDCVYARGDGACTFDHGCARCAGTHPARDCPF